MRRWYTYYSIPLDKTIHVECDDIDCAQNGALRFYRHEETGLSASSVQLRLVVAEPPSTWALLELAPPPDSDM